MELFVEESPRKEVNLLFNTKTKNKNNITNIIWEIKNDELDLSEENRKKFQTLFTLQHAKIYQQNEFNTIFENNINSSLDLNYKLFYKDPVKAFASTSVTTADTNSISTLSYSSRYIEPISSTTSVIYSNNHLNNYWALLALILVIGTAAGNILVCLAIAWERRLQNVTNYFLMSLAITDLMVAVLVMPLGILTLVKGYFPLGSEHCLTWICLDVLFCTASIMHLCTISVDRYLSLRYPMRFGRNKTRRRVTLKIVFVWLLSVAMSLPLSLMYSKDHASVLVNGTCQIPDPVYKLVGSIVCFYIPLGVMLLTYCLTVRLLAQQRQNIGGPNQQGPGWASGWLGQTPALERRCTWRRLLKTGHNTSSAASHAHSANSTDTELSTLDNHELWLPESSVPEPTPTAMTALQQFGAEMLKLSRGLESVASSSTASPTKSELSSGNLLPFPHASLQKPNSLHQYSLSAHQQQTLQMHSHNQHHQLHTHSNHEQFSSQQSHKGQEELISLNQQIFLKNHEFRPINATSSLVNSAKPFLSAMIFTHDFKSQKR
ncbi:hypothetical protein DOY81_005835 [Sarcophaga bullata]|nr:hypothetical protein DOY81_005835 [Sarcophaga bullata]